MKKKGKDLLMKKTISVRDSYGGLDDFTTRISAGAPINVHVPDGA